MGIFKHVPRDSSLMMASPYSNKLEIALTGDRDILHYLEQEGYNIPDDIGVSVTF